MTRYDVRRGAKPLGNFSEYEMLDIWRAGQLKLGDELRIEGRLAWIDATKEGARLDALTRPKTDWVATVCQWLRPDWLIIAATILFFVLYGFWSASHIDDDDGSEWEKASERKDQTNQKEATWEAVKARAEAAGATVTMDVQSGVFVMQCPVDVPVEKAKDLALMAWERLDNPTTVRVENAAGRTVAKATPFGVSAE